MKNKSAPLSNNEKMKSFIVYSPDSQLYRSQTLDEFVESTALAFENYPMFNYIFGDNSKAKDIRIVLSASLRANTCNWIGLSYGGSEIALALFYQPDFKDTKTIPFLLMGGLRLLPRNSFKAITRLSRYENYAMKIMSKYVDHRCWYLQSFAVHPNYQNQGVASATIQPMLDFFDATNQKCFLETNLQSNVGIYEHFGFKVVEFGFLPNSSIPHYAMLRKPITKGQDNNE